MCIYISHCGTQSDVLQMYAVIRSVFSVKYTVICPHETSAEQYNSKELFLSGYCKFVIAEVTEKSIGVGIELGWASLLNIPVICICKDTVTPSKCLSVISDKFISYKDMSDLKKKLNIMFFPTP